MSRIFYEKPEVEVFDIQPSMTVCQSRGNESFKKKNGAGWDLDDEEITPETLSSWNG